MHGCWHGHDLGKALPSKHALEPCRDAPSITLAEATPGKRLAEPHANDGWKQRARAWLSSTVAGSYSLHQLQAMMVVGITAKI